MTARQTKGSDKSVPRKSSFFRSGKWDTISSVLYPLFLAVILAVLWQTGALHKILNTDEFTLPMPNRIGGIISDIWPKIWLNLKSSSIAAISGLLLGSLLGYMLAIAAAVFPNGGAGGLKLVSALNAVPIIAIAPVVNNLVKNISNDIELRGMIAKTLVVILVCTATMSVSAYRGLTDLKPFALDLMDTYAAGGFNSFIKLRLPNSVPSIFTALTVSTPLSVITTLVSEYFIDVKVSTGSSYSPVGVGRMIRENIVTAQYSTAWAYIVIACVMGIGMYITLMAVKVVIVRKH
jgi:ABC-type nitrate/sulfonate/bicarbonate transport system, permease component